MHDHTHDSAGPRPLSQGDAGRKPTAPDPITALPRGTLVTLEHAVLAVDDRGAVRGPHADLWEFALEEAEETLLEYHYEGDGFAGSVSWGVVTILGAHFITHAWDGWEVHHGPYATFDDAVAGAGRQGRVVNPDGNSRIRSSVWGRAEIEAHFTHLVPTPQPGQPVVVEVNGEACVWGVGE